MDPTEANLYELQGATADGQPVTIAYQSGPGTPRLTYRGPGLPPIPGAPSAAVFEVDNEEPELRDTGIGTLASVSLGFVPDGFTVTLTVIIPRVNIVEGVTETVATQAILTQHHTTIQGEKGVKGPLETYTLVPLTGKALTVR